MAKAKKAEEKEPLQLFDRRSYKPPTLIEYGSLWSLTHSNLPGSGDSFGGTGGDQTSPQPAP